MVYFTIALDCCIFMLRLLFSKLAAECLGESYKYMVIN